MSKNKFQFKNSENTGHIRRISRTLKKFLEVKKGVFEFKNNSCCFHIHVFMKKKVNVRKGPCQRRYLTSKKAPGTIGPVLHPTSSFDR